MTNDDFIREHAGDDVRALALQTGKYPDVDMRYALTQIDGRQKARLKIPSWAAVDGVMYPPHLSMEQCSSESTASYKSLLASRLSTRRRRMVDLTAGFGIDYYFIGRMFVQAVYVEQQEMLCDIARHNFSLLGMNQAEVVCGNGVDYLKSMEWSDLIFIDPARRDINGGRTIAVTDCTPDVTLIEELLVEKSEYTIIKLSPMLDWHQLTRELSHICEIHIVSSGHECKEMLAVISGQQHDGIKVFCVSDDGIFSFDENDNAPFAIADPVDFCYLYEPNPSLMKAGCFALLIERYGVKAVGNNSHLLVSHHFVEDFPGRRFVIDSLFPLNKREVKQNLQDIRHANISVRNFPMSVAELRKRLKLNDGGDVYLFATTLADGKKIMIRCRKK